MKYLIIFISSFLIQISSTFYIKYVSEANMIGMIVFAFINPFLALPFTGFMIESKNWNERIKLAFVLCFGYVAGVLIVIKLIK
jgi:hypothetical protein